MTPTKPDPRAHSSHAQHGRSPDVIHNEDVQHEPSDVNLRGLLMFCLGLVVVVGVVQVAMWRLFIVFERQAVQNDPVLSPHARPAGQLPPEPRLLTDEPRNLQEIKAGEAQILQGFGWVDQNTGAARIPIEDAKKKLLESGLPVRAEGEVDPLLGTSLHARGESSGGRAITSKPVAPAEGAAQPAAAPVKQGGH